MLAATLMGISTVQAQAVGGREVYRHCGSNYIESGMDGGASWALTRKASGTCAGQLGVGFRWTNGAWGPTFWADNEIQIWTDQPIAGGHHYGCDTCNVSTT
ncbi:hypothetical protein GCM10027436_08980 [Actinophytocola sediminis]